jgi:hypothetical protein
MMLEDAVHQPRVHQPDLSALLRRATIFSRSTDEQLERLALQYLQWGWACGQPLPPPNEADLGRD